MTVAKLGIICALRREAAVFVNEKLNEQTLIHISKDIILAVSGMGADNAEAMAGKLIGQDIQCLISFGTAGALARNLKPGDICVPKIVKDDMHYEIKVDNKYRDKLLNLLKSHNHSINEGPLLSVGNVIKTSKEKQRVYEQHKSDLVDMESAAIVRIADKHNIPALVIRCIVDSLDTSIPESILQNTGNFGDVNISQLISSLIKQPNDIIKLIYLASDFRQAQKSLQLVSEHTTTLAK